MLHVKVKWTTKKKLNVVRLWPKEYTNYQVFEVRLLEANDLRAFSQKYVGKKLLELQSM